MKRFQVNLTRAQIAWLMRTAVELRPRDHYDLSRRLTIMRRLEMALPAARGPYRLGAKRPHSTRSPSPPPTVP